MLAVLYFGLMELILIESDLQLAQSQRFRSHIVAATLAESAAEMAVEKIVTGASASSQWKNADGTMKWELKRTETNFEVVASGTSIGVRPETATMQIQGHLTPTLHIDWTEHSQ